MVTACDTTSTPEPTAAPSAAGRSQSTPSASPSLPSSISSIRITGPYEGEARQLNGVGATFPAALYSKWFEEYAKLTGVRINYQAIGSGGGIKSIIDQTADFGASDSPMTEEQLHQAKGGEILHIPTTLGAVVPTYNLRGLSKPLRFTPDTLAAIFLGEIIKWNDPRLVADNPDAILPDKDIMVIHRSDGSGTTFVWTDYLSTVSPTWKSTVGRGTSVDWPVGLGAKGNAGVSGEVKQNEFSIGYVELVYAIQNQLSVGDLKNRAGVFVTPSLESVTAAAEALSTTIPADLRVSLIDAPGEKTWPISSLTWLLIYKNMQDKPKAIAITRMMWWADHEGQKYAVSLGYAPLPESLVKRVEEKITSITVDGQPAFPGR
ncbi:MAG: phosphate ABC transporter substrate-binding protein PstS [Chloroflexota bacterium]|nr:MAG: phosphate ABC transporter substrate-binding protein PstS [Chloroflexota bacterium]